MCTIISPDAGIAAHGSCLHTLTNKLVQGDSNNRGINEVEGHAAAALHGGPLAPGKPALQLAFLPALPEHRIAAHQASLQCLGSSAQMPHTLPHIRLPVGPRPTNDDEKPNGALFTLVDTGACLSIGRLDCHRSVCKPHPPMAHEFAHLKDCASAPLFGLGGVVKGKEGASSDDIEAIITCKAPLVVNGSEAHMTIGLGKEVACGTIFVSRLRSCPA